MFSDCNHKFNFHASLLGLLAVMLSSLACQTVMSGLSTPTTEFIAPGAPLSSGFITQTPQEIIIGPTAPQMPEAPVSNANYDGVSFSVDPVVANNVTPRTVPANTPPQDAAPWDAANPEYIQFKFSGYPLTGKDFEPILEVYPVMEYENVNAAAIEKIDSLRQFLKDKPTNPENIPFLPTLNAGQMLHAGIAYLNFKNGAGVRYLTQYGQSFAPINNQSMFYTFQGITSDDKYYVSAIFPVSHPNLPVDGSQVPSGDYQAFTDNYSKYVLEIETTLSSVNASSFTPNLTLLDAMIQSLEIMK